MAENFKEKVVDAAKKTGHTISEAATAAGHKISETAEKVSDWAKEKLHKAGHKVEETKQKAENAASETCGAACSTSEIREHMDVIGSCGNKVGSVDHVEGSLIKLTRKDSPDGQHHYVPLDWVARVDAHVHLNRDCGAAREQWQSSSV